MTVQNDIVGELNGSLASLTAEQRLAALVSQVEGRAVFTTSLGMEDQIITHMIFSQDLDIDVVTLDTGRMFEQTYKVWADTEKRYGKKITPFYPDASAIEALVAKQGINGFYDGLEQRKACCGIRKVEPLGRALSGAKLWVTGIRAEQSQNRDGMPMVEIDNGRDCLKANPLLDWTKADMADYLKANPDIPINELHAQGFPSIGCAPCTRAVTAGEDDRAGRWWWENDDQQECGLHVDENGRLVRNKPAG